tara:strand:- start:21821 stop:22213 length:393 start_codon:yes stop_codon:yes gene_type:complete
MAVVSVANRPNGLISKSKVEVENIIISSASSQLVGDIWWIPLGEEVTITADVNLPDGSLMVMVEKVLNGVEPKDDFRTIATILNGVMTLKFAFGESGNFKFRKERLNLGLDNISAEFHLNFKDVEFDVYV